MEYIPVLIYILAKTFSAFAKLLVHYRVAEPAGSASAASEPSPV